MTTITDFVIAGGGHNSLITAAYLSKAGHEVVVLDARPEIVEVRLSLPNRHHFLVDLEPFGLDNPGEVFFAADRPYGLIEGSVLRDDAPPPGLAWGTFPDLTPLPVVPIKTPVPPRLAVSSPPPAAG